MRPARWTLFAIASLPPLAVTTLALSLRAQSESEIAVGVRSYVDRQKKSWNGTHLNHLPPAPEHSKVYGIVAFRLAQVGSRPLGKPVDEVALKNELIRQMDTHGFQHAGPKRRPDILIMVDYGRGWLPNPYYSNEIDVDNIRAEVDPNPFRFAGENGNNPESHSVYDPNLAARLMENGVEEKATRNSSEKLLIMVRAWKNPPDPKEKPTALWAAVMYVDAPDDRDLNLIAQQMLEAGAPFFDKEIKTEEVEIRKPLPEGHVKVGQPEVVPAANSN